MHNFWYVCCVLCLTLRADDALERIGERHVHVHVIFSAHYLQRIDARHAVGPVERPQLVAAAHDVDLCSWDNNQSFMIYASF